MFVRKKYKAASLITTLSLSLLFIVILTLYASGKNGIDPGKVNNKANENIKVVELVTPTPTLPPIPVSKVLSGGIQVFQTFNNCGPAALSMALSHYGINVSQKDLGDELRPYQIAGGNNDDKSVTFPEIARKAQDYGFATYHRPNGDTQLIKNFISQDIPVITRTWTKINEDIGHYRVIKGYDESKGIIIQDDSLQGKDLEYTYNDFNQLWEAFSFEYLVLIPQEKVEIANSIIGRNLDEKNAWESVIKNSDDKISQDPDNIYAKFNKAVAFFNLGKYEETVNIFETIEPQLPSRMLWYQIEPIVAYQKLGSYNKVFEITDKLIQNGNMAYSEIYQIRGEIYMTQGNSASADSEFEKVIKYNINFYKYWK